jgi:hypothetical protein
VNVINRIIAVLVVIILWAAIVVLAAAPGQGLAWARQGLDWVEVSLFQLSAMQPGWLYPLLRGAAIIVATLLALAWLMQELRRKQTPVVKMRLPSGGEAAVTADSISRRLAWYIDQLADVNNVTPTVRTRGNAVDIDLNLQTAPDVDVPMKTEEVVAVARDVIETQMGLQLNKVKVHIEHAPFKPIL